MTPKSRDRGLCCHCYRSTKKYQKQKYQKYSNYERQRDKRTEEFLAEGLDLMLLNFKQYDTICKYYGLGENRIHTYDEIAAERGVSKQAVAKLVEYSLNKMRSKKLGNVVSLGGQRHKETS